MFTCDTCGQRLRLEQVWNGIRRGRVRYSFTDAAGLRRTVEVRWLCRRCEHCGDEQAEDGD